MDHLTALIIVIEITVLIENTNANVSVPFMHDFDTGQHSWTYDHMAWHWTGNDGPLPDTSQIHLFHSDGNYMWTQNANLNSSLTSRLVTGVTRTTEFHFRYWFHTHDYECDQLSINLTEIGRDNTFRIHKILTNTNKRDDVTTSCQDDTCCEVYDCDLQITIACKFGCAGDTRLIAVRRVWTTDNDMDSTATPWHITETWQWKLTFKIVIPILGIIVSIISSVHYIRIYRRNKRDERDSTPNINGNNHPGNH